VLGIEPISLQNSPRLNSWLQHYHQIQYLFLKAINYKNCETVGVTDRAGFYTLGCSHEGDSEGVAAKLTAGVL
jgi:hypothetical protein